MEKGLLEKTGKPLQHWIKIIKKSKIEKHSEIIKFLKTEHGFTHGFANFVAMTARQAGAEFFNPDELVDSQYSKGKEELRPLYELLIRKIKKIGTGIEIVPKKASVSIKTKKQFALIQPSARTRIDLGLKLRGKPTGKRLKDSGLFGAMCTHRVEVFTKSDIDSELIDWLTEAYEQSL
jgi:predicted transport protein